MVLELFVKVRGLDCFLNKYNLPNVSKYEQVNIELFKVSKMTSLKNLHFSSHVGVRNIKFKEQVNLILRVPLVTPPQEAATLLLHNYVTLTNLFISSYRVANVVKFGQ